MGNSPSRTELQGDHMSSLSNSSQAQETTQAHSFPTKFSSAQPLVHNDYGSSVPNGNGRLELHHHHEKQGRRSTEQLTPDPLYSMDSLNVCGNNGSSITSSELPPSSISPANCQSQQDLWRPSSFSDESLRTQCRNLSRLHKDLHHQEDDEGLSTSTFESDSLNPDATLSGMTIRRNVCIPKREITPKPEVAEEATEEVKSRQSPQRLTKNAQNLKGPTSESNLIDYSITINGRKVTTSEETPLPIVLAAKKESETNGGNDAGSKIGIVSPDIANGSNMKNRGRMKSPPPPPPTKAINSGSDPESDTISSHQPPSTKTSPNQKKRSSSLSSLLRRNVFSGGTRKSSIDANDMKGECSGEMSVMKTPLPRSENFTLCNDHEVLQSQKNHHDDDAPKTKEKSDAVLNGNAQIPTSSSSPPQFQVADVEGRSGWAAVSSADIPFNQTYTKKALKEGKLRGIADAIVIRPCEEAQDINANSCSSKKNELSAPTDFIVNGGMSTTSSFASASSSSSTIRNRETVAEQIHQEDHDDKYREFATNKSELGCKDGEDGRRSGCFANEIKPVSCLPNDEKFEKVGCINSSSSRGGGSVLISEILSSSSSPATCEDDEGGEGFKTSNKSPAVNGAFSIAEEDETRIMSETASITPSNSMKITLSLTSLEEDNVSKFGTVVRKGSKSRENTPPKLDQSTYAHVDADSVNDKHKQSSSRSSSRRGSSSSSVDMSNNNAPIPSSNSLLSCNRLSLCSQPDEVDVEGVVECMVLGHDVAIQDQPLGTKSTERLGSPNETETDQVGNGENSKNTLFSLHATATNGDERSIRNAGLDVDATKEGVDMENKQQAPKAKLSMEFTESLLPSTDLKYENYVTDTPPKVNGHGHHRRLSMTKMDFDCGAITQAVPEETHPVASSAPSEKVSQLEKFIGGRKTSYPELYVSTTGIKASRKLSTGSDKSYNANRETGSSAPTRRSWSGNSSDDYGVNPLSSENSYADRAKTLDTASNRNKATFANDFLQTLGEIYATKSKLLTNNKPTPLPASTPVLPVNGMSSSPPKEKEIPVVTIAKSSKVSESSMESVDMFDCQDRSISEYNISPRSAREVVTDSLLNTSLSSSSSQRSIVATIQEENEKPVVPASFTVSSESNGSSSADGSISSVEVPCNNDVAIPRLTHSKSLTNSATYKKKPTFIRSRVTTGDSLPCVEIFEPPRKKENRVNVDYSGQLKEKFNAEENLPPPPPMPPLQYCQSISDSSSVSSSIGDSVSESSDKSKSPTYEAGEVNKIGAGVPRAPSKTVQKPNGNVSSECSLVELSLANQKSTSDAIIVELKKAQARKMQSLELKSPESLIIDFKSNPKAQDEVQCTKMEFTRLRTEELETQRNKVNQSSSECSEHSVKSAPRPESRDPTDSPVKAIVNGKHTNNIIINGAPTVAVNSNKGPENRVGGTQQTTKQSLAHKRGNIMSPSLSGNYTEMNGIDSETMGASSVHDDELSGQLQQKENHINELQGNLDEVQTSNKLDGASFRRVLNEYEKTLSMFIQQIDQLKQRMDDAETEKQTLIKERDQALEDLRNVESAFSDVHRKYERAKALLENMKTNEDTLIRRDQELLQRIQNRDKKLDMIKEKAQESIEKMHLDYETRIKEMEFENAKLRAQYRKLEMKLSTLENDVEQKAKENAQLSALCDELINGQVGQV